MISLVVRFTVVAWYLGESFAKSTPRDCPSAYNKSTARDYGPLKVRLLSR